MTVRARAILSALIGLVVGAAYPFIDIAVRCHAPASESCVWGNAYFMLTVAVSVPLIGALAAAAAYTCLGWLQPQKTKEDDSDTGSTP